MTGEIAKNSPELGGGGEDCMKLLKELGPEEVLEVLSSGGFCQHCQALIESRVQSLINKKMSKISMSSMSSSEDNLEFSTNKSHIPGSTPLGTFQTHKSIYLAQPRGHTAYCSPASVNSHLGSEILLNDGLGEVPSTVDDGLSEEQKERIRFSQVGRKKDFVYNDRINGKETNVLEGLELHTKVFNAEEQKKIVDCVYNLQRMAQRGQLRERTYSEPRKWMRGKGRVTLQFGCCYNYAADKKGNPPGIIRNEEVDPLPPLFKKMIKRMVRWHVLPPTCIPNSCIVNIYDEGDCIPPHIDHHDFLRPFCTVSFLTQCNMLFGSNLKIVSAGDFSGPVSIPLPVGSVLILNGNGAGIAKHCVPGVPAKRISITFRKMDDSKLPFKFSPDPELLGIKPLGFASVTKSPHQQTQHQKPLSYNSIAKSPAKQNYHQKGKSTENETRSGNTGSTSFFTEKDDFPPLGSSNSLSRPRANRVGSKQ